MSSSSASASSGRVHRFLTTLLTVVTLTGCAATSTSYNSAPQSFPGVQLTRMKAGGFSVRILTNMLGRGNPIYIVDDERVTVEPTRGIDWFQPEDILRIRVLKDPSEIAVYGPDGANGVILITTKQSMRVRRKEYLTLLLHGNKIRPPRETPLGVSRRFYC